MQRVATAHTQAVRRLGLERNPLRRRTDLVEASARIAALALCLVAVPLAVWAGVAVHAHVAAAVAHQAATRIPRTATVEQDPTDMTGRASLAVHRARVSWTTPAGERRTATVDVPGAAHRGSTFTLWTTRDGRPTAAPLERGAPVADAALATMGVEAGALGIAWLSLEAVRRVLDRRRYRQWDADWSRLAAGHPR